MTVNILWRNAVIDSSLGAVGFQELRGWNDSPDVRSSDADRGGMHGQIPGPMLLSGRIVEIDFVILDPAQIPLMLGAIVPVSNPVEETLTISNFETYPPQTVQARPIRWLVPTNRDWFMGRKTGTWQFKATDPTKYSADLLTETCSLPAGSSGLSFGPGGVAWPAAFGTVATGGSVDVTNLGTADTWPVFLLSGPLTGPSITDTATGRTLRFSPSFVIPAGQQVVIDTNAKTALMGGANVRASMLTATWFPLDGSAVTGAPVTHEIGFTAAIAEAGLLTATWRHAWL